jgi:lysophospholipase L1-like esterase
MSHSSLRVRVATAASLVFSLAGCGSNGPTQPPPPPALLITCPPRIEVDSVNGEPVLVTLGTPTTSGGTAPVSSSCSPPAGTLFGGGTTTVTCNASDSRGITASCTTSVFVRTPPRVVGSGRFVAFGDSITAGKFSPGITSVVESEFAYTFPLERSLKGRYILQTPIVINEGVSGEQAHVGGIARLRGVLQRTQPDVLLLMEGTNDLLVSDGVERATAALQSMVRDAKAMNVRVALATVSPQRPGSPRPAGVPELVPVLNERIRTLAQQEAVVLVDVYNAMKDDLSLIGVDGLHPTPRGFEVIADTFFKAIQAQLEQPAPAITLR